MSSSDRGPGAPHAHDPRSDASTEAFGAEWLDGTRPRHAAITRNLQTWSSYQTWAEQMRGSWEAGAAGRDKQEGDAEGEAVSEAADKK
jgi:hypothetical protein